MPIVSWMPVAMAIFSLVPTPSVAATSSGSRKPVRARSKTPPKPPISASAPARSGRVRHALLLGTVVG
jgi:hypothetical protein